MIRGLEGSIMSWPACTQDDAGEYVPKPGTVPTGTLTEKFIRTVLKRFRKYFFREKRRRNLTKYIFTTHTRLSNGSMSKRNYSLY